ncbi:MAG TPA: hypothetical protein VM144_16955 [Aestuariivirga sp.]|nr:hypothetical protein [Aestuariivirga sp.]
MGKRGPAPKGEYPNQSAVLSTRIRPDTRNALVAAAKASHRSLSQEIEHRLTRTFKDDKTLVEIFGGRKNFALVRILAATFEFAGTDNGAHWTDDPKEFHQVVTAINTVLSGLRPIGDTDYEPEGSDNISKIIAEGENTRGQRNAWRMLHAVQNADPALPLAEGTVREHLAGVLKNDLGKLINRPKIIYGNADEMRAEAERLRKLEKKRKPK